MERGGEEKGGRGRGIMGREKLKGERMGKGKNKVGEGDGRRGRIKWIEGDGKG